MSDLYLPISEAVQKYHLDLYALVKLGKIRTAMINTSPGVEFVSDEDILAFLPKEDRPEYQQFYHLKGTRIGIREAGRKYNLSNVTIRQWVSRGLIKQYGKESVRGGYKTLIDEADIAYCAHIRSHNPGRGHWLFKDDGTPRK